MDFDSAREFILTYLQAWNGATNSRLIELIGGDVSLFERIKEDLIFNDLAEDKKGAGLVYIGSANVIAEEKTGLQDCPESVKNEVPVSHKVFISYGRKDAETVANKLSADLEALGHNVWLDREQIRTGASWEEQIENAVLACDYFISLLTPHAVRRPDGICLDEISLARYNNRRIIPLMVINCRPPLGIFRLDWLDLQDWENPVTYEKILKKIQILLQSGNTEVEGIHSNIFSLLKPIDFKLDIYRHVKDFTGREWILRKIQEWLIKLTGNVLFITGDPGTGKTALMSKLIQLMPQIGAFHFCMAKFETSLAPEKFIHSIASQLATQLPDYRGIISSLNLQTLAYLESGVMIKQLIIDPLSQIQRMEPLVILIDALDEALFKGNENIAKLLFDWIDAFPKWVKVIITSRKVPEILGMFDFYTPYEIDVDSEENRKDIKQYVTDMLTENKDISLSNYLIEDIAEKITSQSAGIFLYAKTSIQSIVTGTYNPDRADSLPSGLGGIYQTNFSRIFHDSEKFHGIRPLLEIILASFKPLTIHELAHFLSDSAYSVRKLLLTVSEFFPENVETYSAFHKSLADWLSGKSDQIHPFICDVKKGHAVIAEVLLNDYRGTRPDDYCVRYLSRHLFHSGRLKEMQKLLTDIIYVETRSAIHQVYSLIEDYKLYFSHERSLSKDFPAQDDNKIWDPERHFYESEKITASLTPEKTISAIQEFLFRQAGLIQLYGHIPGFVYQQAFNDGLFPSLFQEDPWNVNNSHCLLLTDSFRKQFDPFPFVTMEFHEHRLGISDLSVSTDTRHLVSASFDKTVKLWDLITGECIKTLKFNHIIESLAFVPDSSSIAIAGGEQEVTVYLYDSRLEKIIQTLHGSTGKISMMKISQNHRLISCSSDNNLVCWDLTNRSIIFKKNYSCGLLACSISANGTTVAVSTTKDVIEVWNIDFDFLIFKQKHTKGTVRALNLTSDGGELIIGGSMDRKTEVWDLKDQKLKYTVTGHGTTTYCLYVNNQKTTLITGGNDQFLRIWDFRTGNLIKMHESHSRVTRRITAVDDLKTVITGGGWNSDYNIRKVDIIRSRGIDGRSFDTTSIIALMYAESKNWIIGANRKSVFRIDINTGELKMLRDDLSLQSARKYNNTLYIVTDGGTILRLRYDYGTWENCYRNQETLVAFLPTSEDNWIAGDVKGNVVLKKGNLVRILNRLDEMMIRQIFISSDYYVILSYGDRFHFLNRDTGDLEHTYQHPSRITGNLITSDENLLFGDVSGSIARFNTSEMRKEVISKAHKAEITSLAILKQNDKIISGCCDGIIKIWDPTLTCEMLEIKGHESNINLLNPLEGPYFLSAGGNQSSGLKFNENETKDTSLKKWNSITGECVAVYPSNELITSLNTDKQGFISIGRRNGTIQVFRYQNM